MSTANQLRKGSIYAAAALMFMFSGCSNVTTPDVAGLTQEAAETALSNAGLTLGEITYGASDTVEAGRVIGQVPAAGSSVASGTAVALTPVLGPGFGRRRGGK